MNKIAVTITIDHSRRTISAKRTGDRCPLAYIQDSSQSALAGIYRDCAAYFLDLAGQILGEPGSIKEQAAVMLAEHKPIFE